MLGEVQRRGSPTKLFELSFRPCKDNDIPALARLAKEAWPANSTVGSVEDELSGMESYIEYSLSVSNWTEVAEAKEGVVGFLLGRIDRYPTRPLARRTFVGEFPAALSWLLKRREKTSWHLSFAWAILLTDLKLMLNRPASDASIEMFIVDSRHRGKGIGRELMERFLEAARRAGSKSVTVYTDDRMSNWQYYERWGFKKIKIFYDNITSKYSGRPAQGMIFVLDIGGGK